MICYTKGVSFWNHWKYKNLTFLFLSIILAVLLSRIEVIHSFLLHLGGFGYLGAFIAGILFVNVLTVSTGALILLILVKNISALEVGIIAGLGAVVGDLLIFHFVKDSISRELKLVYNKVDHKHHLVKLLHTKYFNWSLPVIGALIIASPFPDELGVTLMGISQMKTYKFMVVSYLLNTLGIVSVVSAASLMKL